MTTNVPVDNGGHLIGSIGVVHWCQGTKACHNVVDCLQVCTAKTASRPDISMQNVAFIIPSLKKFGLEQQQPVPQLQQEDSMASAMHKCLSCPQVVSQ